MKKVYINELGLLLVAIVWGYGFVAARDSINSLDVYVTIFIRFLISALLMSLIFFKKIKAIKRSTIKRGTITGVFLFLGFILQTVALLYTTSSKNAFLTAFNVILVPIISWVIWKRKLKKTELIAAFISLAGIALISLNFDFSINLGDLLTLSCAVMFALQIITTDIYVKDEDPIAFTLVQMAVCALLGLITLLVSGHTDMPTTLSSYKSVLYLGIVSTMLAFIIQSICQKRVNETKSAILLSTESLWGSLFSIMFLGETPTKRILFGGLLMFLAVILATVNFKGIKRIRRKE